MLLALVLTATSCAYLNTFYNAERAYSEGVRLKAGAGDSLSAPAREAFEKAAEKSAVVLSRHGDSSYADDALLLLGESLIQLGRDSDARSAFRRLLDRFPDSELAPRARLGLVRAARRMEDYTVARAEIAGIDPGDVDPGLVLFERAMVERATGDHEAAVKTLRTLLEKEPEFARREEVGLRFADAELAAGEYDAAIQAYRAHRDGAEEATQRRRAGFRLAEAYALAGREEEAMATYDELLSGSLADSLAARAHLSRGELLEMRRQWDDAEREYRRAAELAPGSETASRATLRRGRITWRVHDDREEALEVLLDAFLHAPRSAWGDSARAEARALERLLHYARLAEEGGASAAIDDPELARATALYRLGEEILDIEEDPEAAASVFEKLSREHPGTPWGPKALLAAGTLRLRQGAEPEGRELLETLLSEHPEHPASDSARRALGLPVPDRPDGFYGEAPLLHSLARSLPKASDPMVRVADQIGRYATRSEGAGAAGGAAGAAGVGAGSAGRVGADGKAGEGVAPGAGDEKTPGVPATRQPEAKP